ncbi:MAG: SDR family oxidoreductase [Proteobacteria bacterium]|nr:SDR family oxidoreductase [Pseudomonadota bacterium]MBU4010166.1 SDR family oxidoreductase [Pseudomonadota bacterium]
MTNILITGANGFVGRALCAQMLIKGWDIRASVRSRDNIQSLPGEVEITETGSIGPDTDWSVALANVEAVIHLAGRVHVMDDLTSDPLSEYRIVNTAGTERLARCAALSGVRLFVFISTIKVNGEGKPTPYTEEDIPEPQDPYGTSKWEAEEKLKLIADQTGMKIVIIRAPMIYGPEVRANFLRLLKAVDKGMPLPVAGIKNKRSMIYLGNLVDIIINCIANNKTEQMTYLVSDGEDMSTPELVRQMAKSLGKPARLFYVPLFMLRLGGLLTGKSHTIERLVDSLAVDSSKIRKELNWKPPFTLEQGLKETVEWYKTWQNSR